MRKIINIKREQGDTKRISLTMTDKRGNPVPMTGWTNLTLTIDKNENPINNLTNVSQSTGSLVGTGADGRFYFPCVGTIPAGDYYHQMSAVNTDGEKVTFANGLYTVLLNGKNPLTPEDPLVMVQGEEFFIGWRFTWSNGDVKNLTGHSVRVQIRPFAGSIRPIALFTETSPEITSLLQYGAIDLRIPPAMTLLYNFREAVIDCYVYNSTDGDRSPLTKIKYIRGSSI